MGSCRSAIFVRVALAVLVGSSSGCVGRLPIWRRDRDEAAVGRAARSSAEALARGDEAWARRDSRDAVLAALSAWEEALAGRPGDVELLVKLARGSYYLADVHLREEPAAYLAVMDEAASWGERALISVSPEFRRRVDRRDVFVDAVAAVGPNGVPALYWYAAALGRWAQAKGVGALLAHHDEIRAAMNRCLELDPRYFHAGPHRYFGAYYAIVPAVAGGDLEKSRFHFARSLELAPGYLGTRLLWAAELAVREHDRATFERLLGEVIAASPDVLPDVAFEARADQAKARALLSRVDQLF